MDNNTMDYIIKAKDVVVNIETSLKRIRTRALLYSVFSIICAALVIVLFYYGLINIHNRDQIIITISKIAFVPILLLSVIIYLAIVSKFYWSLIIKDRVIYIKNGKKVTTIPYNQLINIDTIEYEKHEIRDNSIDKLYTTEYLRIKYLNDNGNIINIELPFNRGGSFRWKFMDDTNINDIYNLKAFFITREDMRRTSNIDSMKGYYDIRTIDEENVVIQIVNDNAIREHKKNNMKLVFFVIAPFIVALLYAIMNIIINKL